MLPSEYDRRRDDRLHHQELPAQILLQASPQRYSSLAELRTRIGRLPGAREPEPDQHPRGPEPHDGLRMPTQGWQRESLDRGPLRARHEPVGTPLEARPNTGRILERPPVKCWNCEERGHLKHECPTGGGRMAKQGRSRPAPYQSFNFGRPEAKPASSRMLPHPKSDVQSNKGDFAGYPNLVVPITIGSQELNAVVESREWFITTTMSLY